MIKRIQGIGAIIAVCGVMAGGVAGAQQAPVSPAKKGNGFAISRGNLAQSASFTVTQTLSPKGGTPLVRSYKVEVKGEKARLDFEDDNIGPVRYLANEKGVFFYIPANKNAMKQGFNGGVEGALKVAFAQVKERMASAEKVGKATISGVPTDVYRDAKTGGMVYIGTKPGFRLPVKTILTNEGGATTMEVKDIKLNVALDDARFALPPGTKVIESEKGASAGLPGAR